MKNYKISFFYFTGTGNTLLVVKKMIETFKSFNIETLTYKIENYYNEKYKLEVLIKELYKNSLNENKILLIGLGFPVHSQGANPIVWEFVENLPFVNKILNEIKKFNNSFFNYELMHNIEVFMVDTLMLFSGGVVGPIKKILNKKGYLTIGAREIIMPSNIRFKKIKRKTFEKKVNKALKNAEKYAKDILKGKSRWIRIPILSDIMSKLSKNQKEWEKYRKLFPVNVNKEKCVKCNLCEKLCPVKNIKIINKYPEFSNKCVFCLRCFSFCPTSAIYFKKLKLKQYQAVKSAQLLEKL